MGAGVEARFDMLDMWWFGGGCIPPGTHEWGIWCRVVSGPLEVRGRGGKTIGLSHTVWFWNLEPTPSLQMAECQSGSERQFYPPILENVRRFNDALKDGLGLGHLHIPEVLHK